MILLDTSVTGGNLEILLKFFIIFFFAFEKRTFVVTDLGVNVNVKHIF